MGAPQSALNTHAPALILSFRFTDLTIWEVEKSWKHRSVLSRHRPQVGSLQLIHLQKVGYVDSECEHITPILCGGACISGGSAAHHSLNWTKKFFIFSLTGAVWRVKVSFASSNATSTILFCGF